MSSLVVGISTTIFESPATYITEITKITKRGVITMKGIQELQEIAQKADFLNFETKFKHNYPA